MRVHDQCSDAEGTADLVATDGHRRCGNLGQVHGYLTQRLNGVGVKRDTRFLAQCGDFTNGLNRADLVVRPHHGDQRSTKGVVSEMLG